MVEHGLCGNVVRVRLHYVQGLGFRSQIMLSGVGLGVRGSVLGLGLPLNLNMQSLDAHPDEAIVKEHHLGTFQMVIRALKPKPRTRNLTFADHSHRR